MVRLLSLIVLSFSFSFQSFAQLPQFSGHCPVMETYDRVGVKEGFGWSSKKSDAEATAIRNCKNNVPAITEERNKELNQWRCERIPLCNFDAELGEAQECSVVECVPARFGPDWACRAVGYEAYYIMSCEAEAIQVESLQEPVSAPLSR